MIDTHEANGARFIARDDMIVRWERAERRKFEPETTLWLFTRLHQRPGLFIDVGASTGWFSIPAALRGHDVLAVEPHPTVRARLAENAALNGVSLAIVAAAASREPGSATFYHNPRLPLTSGGSIEAATCSCPDQITVDTVALDDIVPRVPVSLIKIDVEGHEMAVLAGCEGIILEEGPALVLEANTDDHRAELVRWLEDRGYTWTRADERNLLCTRAF